MKLNGNQSAFRFILGAGCSKSGTFESFERNSNLKH
jgi:hypothetical protein